MNRIESYMGRVDRLLSRYFGLLREGRRWEAESLMRRIRELLDRWSAFRLNGSA